jgi:nitrite reductase/ring-hydroxylating ferredoxin subunit
MSERQIALFRLSSGDVHAVATVASPMHKQSYDLVRGECLDDAALSLRVWPTRVVDGAVEVQVEVLEGAGVGAA